MYSVQSKCKRSVPTSGSNHVQKKKTLQLSGHDMLAGSTVIVSSLACDIVCVCNKLCEKWSLTVICVCIDTQCIYSTFPSYSIFFSLGVCLSLFDWHCTADGAEEWARSSWS